MRPIRWAKRFVREHPGRAAVLIGLGLGLGVFGIVWFEPHKLFIDERVNEPPPMAETMTVGLPDTGTMAEMPLAGPTTLARGSFRSLEHESSGGARVVELPDGARFLRFEDLRTSNGPDLRVYLSEIPAGDDWYVYGERFVDLGALKGNEGSQNYRIPKGVDLERIRSAVIWCRRFTVGFAVAPLKV